MHICSSPASCAERQLQTVREHFSSPLLQYNASDGGQTFTLVECPSVHLSLVLERLCAELERTGGTGQLISRLEKDEIDVAMFVLFLFMNAFTLSLSQSVD